MFALSDFPLKYNLDALAPDMSARTLEFHYGKHLDTYIKNLNALMPGTKFDGLPLPEIVAEAAKSPEFAKIFNNAAQIMNHDFFFKCLGANGAAAKFPAAIGRAFGTREAFNAAFKDAAASVFGSGWVWLVDGGNGMEILKTANADTPFARGIRPILVLDVWEHAYYLDYQNRRADFIDAFLERMIDWDFVGKNLSSTPPSAHL